METGEFIKELLTCRSMNKPQTAISPTRAEDYPEWSRKRLEQVWSDMSVVNMLKMNKPYKWPFKDMQVGDEASFYPVTAKAVRAAHTYGAKRGWKFKSFQEWPLTIIQRVS